MVEGKRSIPQLVGIEIDRRPNPPQATPFFTRASTLAFSLVAIAAFVAFTPLFAVSNRGSGTAGAIAALAEGIAVVAGTVAWVGGCLLAIRRGSMLWVLVALFIPLVGPVMVALSTPPTPPSR